MEGMDVSRFHMDPLTEYENDDADCVGTSKILDLINITKILDDLFWAARILAQNKAH